MKRINWKLVGLIFILLVAASLRFYGLAWDGGYLFHPDERKILLVASELRLPNGILEFLSADSPLNPKFFAYGSFPIYLLKVLSAVAPPISMDVPWREDFVGLAMLGRALSALFDLGTIGLTFLLVRRLYDATVGLMASACIAVTVLHIQLAHFYAVDTILTFFVVATMYCAARYAQSNLRRDAILLGVSFGLALATKITAAPLVIPITVAVVRASRGAEKQRSMGELLPRSSAHLLLIKRWLDLIWEVRRSLAIIFVVALAVFIITQPYVLLDPVRYIGAVGTELLVARGWLDYPYTRQYADTLPFIYPIVQSSVWGMSLPLGIFAWGGSALFAWRWWRTRYWVDGLILSWAFIYFLATGGQYAKYLRYLLPLLPFLYIMAVSSFRFQVPSFRKHFVRFAFCGSVFLALIYSFAFVGMYSREHPWLTFSRWMYANVPAQSTLAIEHWDDALPVPMKSAAGDRSPADYRMRLLPMYDADDAKKLDAMVDVLQESDYVVLATQRLSSTITRLPQRYPIASRYYRLLFDGQLGFELATHALNGIALDGIVILDDRFNGQIYSGLLRFDALVWNWGCADESFTVYDHPMPLIFKKTHTLSQAELRVLLTNP